MPDHDHERASRGRASLDATPQTLSSHDSSRRRFLVRLAAAGLAAPFLATALADSHRHDSADGGMASSGGPGMAGTAMGGPLIGPDLLAAADIPWEDGTCAFCGMTLATPSQGPFPAGFRERTYAQIRLAGGDGLAGDALHFESLACMANYAFARQLRDGHGASMYVADESAPQIPAHGLVPAREASFVWAEGLRVSMNARLAAYPNDEAAHAALARLDMPGRYRLIDAVALYDLAPWAEMNLIPLLAEAAGLFDE